MPQAFGRFSDLTSNYWGNMAPRSIQAHKRQGQKVQSAFSRRSIRNIESQNAEFASWAKDLGRRNICPPRLVRCAQYRLSSHPGGRFPAALQDAVTSFQHLLDLGVPALQIILSDDSAGGHLALSLLRYNSDRERCLVLLLRYSGVRGSTLRIQGPSIEVRTARLTIWDPLLRTGVCEHSYPCSCGEMSRISRL
jgi:alpha/beta hydrolase fold